MFYFFCLQFSYILCCCDPIIIWTGNKRRHEESFKEHQHEASKPFNIFEIASFVWEFLWRWWEAVLSKWFVSWWSEGIYPWASLPGWYEIFNISIFYYTIYSFIVFLIPIMMVLGVKQMSILLVIGEQHAPECVMCVVPTPEVHMDEQLLLCLELVTLLLVLSKLLPILTLVHIEVLCHRLIMLTTARKHLLLDVCPIFIVFYLICKHEFCYEYG